MWQWIVSFKEIVGVVAACIAVGAGVAGVIAFFATKSELAALDCRATLNVLLLDTNTKLLAADQTIFNSKVTLDFLINSKAPKTEISRVEEVIATKRKESENLRLDQTAYEKALKTGDCSL
jgi:hypothetical protein